MRLGLAPGVKCWFQRKLKKKKKKIAVSSSFPHLKKRAYKSSSYFGKEPRDFILELGCTAWRGTPGLAQLIHRLSRTQTQLYFHSGRYEHASLLVESLRTLSDSLLLFLLSPRNRCLSLRTPISHCRIRLWPFGIHHWVTLGAGPSVLALLAPIVCGWVCDG